MSQTILITGGNSGIGKQAALDLAKRGNHVIIAGRDLQKGDETVSEGKSFSGKITFVQADLSSNQGVNTFADNIKANYDQLDALILGAGVLTTKDERTADDLHAVFAVNYLSRFHVTELLKPLLHASPNPKVILLVAGVPLTSKIDFNVFPKYKPFPGFGSLSSIQIANYHYVSSLAKEGWVSAGVVSAGIVKTDIFRKFPGIVKVLANIFLPLFAISVEKSASNLVAAAESPAWKEARYWDKSGKSTDFVTLSLDEEVTLKVVEVSKQVANV